MKAINITAYVDDASQIEAIKAAIRGFNIKFDISKPVEVAPLYNPEFVAMIKQGEQDLKDGKGIKMSLNELEDLCK